MKLLISLPQGLSRLSGLHALLAQKMAAAGLSAPQLFTGCDPPGHPLGSGGGTCSLLERCHTAEAGPGVPFEAWLPQERRVVLHAGGQSRRLPAYAPCGKALLPLPLLPSWAAGHDLGATPHVGQTLLSASYPLLKGLADCAPPHMHTLVACGDVLVHTEETPRASMDRLLRGAAASGSGSGSGSGSIESIDVICFGVDVVSGAADEEATMQKHGVFYCDPDSPFDLQYMLQKPDLATIRRQPPRLLASVDTGMWLLSDRAVHALRQRASGGHCDLFGGVGRALGLRPSAPEDDEPRGWLPLRSLRTCVVPLWGGRFYHFGSSADVLASVCAMDSQHGERRRWRARQQHLSLLEWGASCSTPSPAPSAAVGASGSGSEAAPVPYCFSSVDPTTRAPTRVVVFQSVVECPLPSPPPVGAGAAATHIWIENCHLRPGWRLNSHHLLTGVPAAFDWDVELPSRVCLDVVPLRGGRGWALRPYGFHDDFSTAGDDDGDGAHFLNGPLRVWLRARGLQSSEVTTAGAAADGNGGDVYKAALFPCSDSPVLLGRLLRWMITPPPPPPASTVADAETRALWLATPRVSCADLTGLADIVALETQRDTVQRRYLALLAAPELPYHRIFYQSDLGAAADAFARLALPLPGPPSSLLLRPPRSPPVVALEAMHYYMFAARLLRLRPASSAAPPGGPPGAPPPLLPYPLAAAEAEEKAFGVLRDATVASLRLSADGLAAPRRTTHEDQVVWARSPLRLDVAGGWTDTPPYCVLHGGTVVNLAVLLNGQQPVQVYLRLRATPEVLLRSTDLGAECVVRSYEDLRALGGIGSAFAVPKAAVALAGFLPEYRHPRHRAHASLADQLASDFGGCGIEMTLFVAVPMGSGLGTSSIVSGTVLRALADFCGLGWSEAAVCQRVLSLEQLLTTGGGWQDAYGGLLPGVKTLASRPGLPQDPAVHYLPDRLLTAPARRGLHLLYYTGVQRVARSILADIVRGVLLHRGARLRVLREMAYHTRAMQAAIAADDLRAYGRLLDEGLALKQRLDAGTITPAIAAALDRVRPWTAGATIAGAGGGGYLYLVARDLAAAECIRRELTERPVAPSARFVEMELDNTGITVTRS